MLRVLDKDGLVVCPTDTVYSFAAKLGSPKAFDRCAVEHPAMLGEGHPARCHLLDEEAPA